MRFLFLLSLVGIVFFSSCKKDEQYLWRDTGVWRIQSMKIEYLNASGGVDSVVESPISGCFMFYNTPTDDADPVYLVTHGITVKGVEIHGAHYYQVRDKQIYMEDYNGVQFRLYNVSHKTRNKETWDYEGPLLGLHTNNDPNMQVREHIELKRDKWRDDQ